jgi:hypothetical protein
MNCSSLKDQFESSSGVDTPSPQEVIRREELLVKTTTDIHNLLGAFQQELYGRILAEITNGSLRPLAVELAGSKALLDSFVTLGLPRAVANDEFLHALLFGEQKLMEDSQILRSYAISAIQPITDVNPLVNPRLVIEQTAGERFDVFRELLKAYLDAITAQTHIELPDYIAVLRRMLELTVRIAHLDFPETPVPPVTPMPPETPAPPETPVPPVTPIPPETPISPITPTPPTTPTTDTNRVHLPSVAR